MPASRRLLPLLALVFLVALLAGCSAVGGIFKAGVWVGIAAVIALVALVAWLVSRGRGG